MNYLNKIPARAVMFCGMLGFLFLISCGSSERSTGAVHSLDAATFSSAKEITQLTDFLAADDLSGRAAGTAGINKAAEFIIGHFRESGLKPYFNSYKDTLENFEPTTYNVVGMVPGQHPELKDEVIIIGAHYDHIGVIEGKAGDSIANGANDNASGSATVMELARFFGNSGKLDRTLVFALFSAEENGLKGSRHLAQKLKSRGVTPAMVLNYEMTGIPLQDKDYLVYMTGYKLSNLADTMNEIAGEPVVGFLPQAQEYNLFKRSDNYPFYEVFGLPAHTFSTFDFTNFDHYHQPGDEAELMQGEHMVTVVREMIPIITQLANGPMNVKMK